MTDPIPQHLKPKRDRLVLAQSERSIYLLTLQAGPSPEEHMEHLATPDFLSQLGGALRPLDRLEVVSDDLAWWCEFIVLSIDATNGVVLKPIRGISLDGMGTRDAAQRDTTGLHAQYLGPFRKWAVKRGDEVLAEKLQTEAAALQWIQQHMQAHRKPAA